MRSVVRSVCFVILLLAGARSAAAQETLTLAWDPSATAGVSGYILSWGVREGQYPNKIDVGNRTDWTISGLDKDQRYFFVVQAYAGAPPSLSDPTAPVNNGGVTTQGPGVLPDDRPSLFWRNKQTGALKTWHLNGINVVDTRVPSVASNPDTHWKIAGTGDMNGDGFSDIVWRHDTTGGLAVWFLQNNFVFSSGYLSIPAVADQAWRLAGVGDTDGDRRADLVWQHTDGSLATWFMNGLKVVRTQKLSIAKVADTAWQIAQVADLNNDGRADLVWRHNDGWLAGWLLNGATVKESSFLSVTRMTDPAWRLAAAGRLDTTSPSALVWQHNTGGIAVWYMNKYTVIGSSFLNPSTVYDTNWAIVGAR